MRSTLKALETRGLVRPIGAAQRQLRYELTSAGVKALEWHRYEQAEIPL